MTSEHGEIGSICHFSRALPAGIWGHCPQVLVFLLAFSIWGHTNRDVTTTTLQTGENTK